MRTTVEVEAVRQELERILASSVFRSAQRSQAFLRHVVESTLQGHAPKEYEIAVDVLGRGSNYDPAVDAAVRVEAGRLRGRLREYYQTAGDQTGSVLIDIPKGGYSAAFTSLEAEPLPVPTVFAAGEIGPSQEHGISSSGVAGVQSRAWSKKISIAVVAILVIAGAAIWLGTKQLRGPGSIRSIAVLPLQNLSGVVAEEWFADGMTDELITELARIPGLRVVSRTSIMQEKGTRKSLSEIARELEVDAVVEGTVMRSGDKVRITAQLIDGRSDRHLWANSFEGQTGDVLSLQDEVAREIAAETKTAIRPAIGAQFTSARHINPDAHDAYLRGLYFTERREGYLAVKYFREAIQLDPEYASAYAGLAEALLTETESDRARPSDVMPSAIAAARRAIELDPENGEAYTALGAIEIEYLWDWKAAGRDLQRGIALSPNSVMAEIRYVIYLDDTDQPDSAVIHMRRAVALDPLSFWANRHLGAALYYDRKYDDALAALDRSAEIAPDKLLLVAGWRNGIYEVRGQYDKAAAGELAVMAGGKTPEELRLLRSAYDHGGWRAYQQARIRQLLLRAARAGEEYTFNEIAISYMRLGELDEAFRWLDREADEHSFWVLAIEADPRFDGVRSDPRYLALLKRVGLAG